MSGNRLGRLWRLALELEFGWDKTQASSPIVARQDLNRGPRRSFRARGRKNYSIKRDQLFGIPDHIIVALSGQVPEAR